LNKQIKVQAEEIFPVILESLKNNQIVEIKITGSSMKPLLKHQKTTVGLQSFSGVLKRHHIFLFTINEKYILHRFLKNRADKLIFRGDALYRYEYPKKEDILAEVVYIKNDGRPIKPYSAWNMVKLNFYLFFKNIKIFIRKLLGRDNG